MPRVERAAEAAAERRRIRRGLAAEPTVATRRDSIADAGRRARHDRAAAGVRGLRLAWDRLERGAAEPAARCRPWGSALAVVGLAGIGVGPAPAARRALGGPALPAARDGWLTTRR